MDGWEGEGGVWTGIQPWEEGLKWSKRQTGWSPALPDSICRIQTLRSPESPSHVPCASEIAADSRLRTRGMRQQKRFRDRLREKDQGQTGRSILASFPSPSQPQLLSGWEWGAPPAPTEARD